MLTKSTRFLSTFIFAVGVATSSAAIADDGNPNTRTLNKASRAKDPVASVMGLSDVCGTVKNVTGREFLWKSEISNHINPGDPRATGPTFICNQVCPKAWPIPFYYSDGVEAGTVGYYGRWNVTNKPRAYCAAGGAPQCFINTIARNSRSRGRNGSLYVRISGKGRTGVCYKVAPLGRTGNAL
jgi:hypothetical protein